LATTSPDKRIAPILTLAEKPVCVQRSLLELFDTQAIDQISVCHYSRAHHAVTCYRRFPEGARKAPNWRGSVRPFVLSDGIVTVGRSFLRIFLWPPMIDFGLLSSPTPCWQLATWWKRRIATSRTPKWIFGAFVQLAYSVAVESFLIYLKDGARQMFGRKLLNGEANCLCGCRESSICYRPLGASLISARK
jgi:hypothetical protein